MALSVDWGKLRETIYGLREGDIVEIHFCDASKNRRVKRLDNKVVACYKKVVAEFYSIVPDTAYGVEHMLLFDLTEGEIDRPTVWSIPVPSIIAVLIITGQPTKETSDIGSVYLGGNKLKIVTREDGLGERIGE